MAETEQPKQQIEYLTNWFTANAPTWQGEFYPKAREILDEKFAGAGIKMVITPGYGTDPNSQRLELRGQPGERLQQAKAALDKLMLEVRK